MSRIKSVVRKVEIIKPKENGEPFQRIETIVESHLLFFNQFHWNGFEIENILLFLIRKSVWKIPIIDSKSVLREK